MKYSLRVPVVVLICLLLTGTVVSGPRERLEPEIAELVVDLVRAAIEYDLYFARCRGDVSGRRTDKVKKVLIRKYRITVVQVLDDYFPERSHQEARKTLERGFLGRLSEVGGCNQAKKQGLRDGLRSRYEELLDRLLQIP